MITCDVLIIGAGFAGASSVWHLAHEKKLKVVCVEMEEAPGKHSSGLNASMVRQFDDDVEGEPYIFEAERFLLRPPRQWARIFDQSGSIITFKNARMEKMATALEYYKKLGLEAELIDKKIAEGIVPFLKGADYDHAIYTSTDGVVNTNGLLDIYVSEARKNGATVNFKESVSSIKKGGAGFIVTTDHAEYETRFLVNAAGSWIGSIGKMADLTNIEFTPFRRHLHQTNEMKNVDNGWPFVWDFDHQFYFRPEEGGLLLSACDEDAVEPGNETTAPEVRTELMKKLSNHCPTLKNISIKREWAGIRTFAKDKNFVIGPDASNPNFIWAGALGGSGVGASWLVGKYVKDAILNNGEKIPEVFSPLRF